jgi:hypothetical protein
MMPAVPDPNTRAAADAFFFPFPSPCPPPIFVFFQYLKKKSPTTQQSKTLEKNNAKVLKAAMALPSEVTDGKVLCK